MQKNYRNILWDWNGTLLNDVGLCVDTLNILLENYSLPQINKDVYLKYFGFPVVDFYRRIGFDFTKQSFEIIGKEYIDFYEKRVSEVGLHNQAVLLLNEFKAKGLKQYILSARQQVALEQELKFHNISSYFEKVSGLDNYYANGKTESGKILMQNAGLDKKETLMIGDTFHDFEVAKELGISCFLISHGHNRHETLAQTGAPVFETLSEIKSMIINT